MTRVVLVLAIAIGASCGVRAQMPYIGAPCGGHGDKPTSVQSAAFQRFDTSLRTALRHHDAMSLAFLVHFPLAVHTAKGTLLIPDAASLAGHFGEIFPAALQAKILTTTPADYICRYDEGVGYRTGAIWASTTDGRMFGVDAVNVEVVETAPSASLAFTCETTKHRIAITALPRDMYRYRSWNKPRGTGEAPNVDLTGGTLHSEGTGICSYDLYTFTKGDVTYEIDQGLGCGDGSEPARATGTLSVKIAGKQVTQAYCY